jgi:cephalosporin hydroxylase
MEVGTYRGCSLLSAALFNSDIECVGIDDFSQFDPKQENEKYLRDNINKFENPKNITLCNGNFEEVIPKYFRQNTNSKIQVYFYDGSHSFADQLRGLDIVRPYLATECIILVDDLNVPEVERANKKFLRNNPKFRSVFRIKTHGDDPKTWWNGFEVIATI